MSTKRKQLEGMLHIYKEQTGTQQVDMKDVAQFAIDRGWEVPEPKSKVERLAEQLAQVAREEIRHDAVTGKPYRANHALKVSSGQTVLHLWIDIDEAPRQPMRKSLITRREQMVGDGLQVTLDADHWNSIHPNEEPITIPMDFTDDIEWRKNDPGQSNAA